MRRRVGDGQRLAGAEDLLDLRVLREVEAQIGELLVVTRDHHVADVLLARFRGEDDGDAGDVHDVGDAPDHGVEDLAEVEGRSQRLGQLEHDLSVLLLVGEGLHEAAHAELGADPCGQLRGGERPPYDVVRADLEGALEGGAIVRIRDEHGGDLSDARVSAQLPEHAQPRFGVGPLDQQQAIVRRARRDVVALLDHHRLEIGSFQHVHELRSGSSVVRKNQDSTRLGHSRSPS